MSQLPASEGWRRLHPVTPMVRAGRIVPAFPAARDFDGTLGGGEPHGRDRLPDRAGVRFGGLRLRPLDGDPLAHRGRRVAHRDGLIRKDSKRLPLARIQAVDIVRPLLARMLGVSELRIRLAGSGSTDGRLGYLGQGEAAELRLALLAGHVDTEAAPGTNTGLPMAIVTPGRLIGSVLLSLVSLVLPGPRHPVRAGPVRTEDGGRGGGRPGGLPLRLRRHRLAPPVGPVQLHGRRGPRGRAHHPRAAPDDFGDDPLRAHPGRAPGGTDAVAPLRLVPPGGGHRGRDGAEPARRGHGRRAQGPPAGGLAEGLVAPAVPAARWARPGAHGPARRARLKAPLSFHFLSAGHDDPHAVCVTGRINRATTWVPLEKTQSVRRVQGPLQRPLGLATVHVDVAGRRTRAEFRDRTVEEAEQLLAELTELSRLARLHPRRRRRRCRWVRRAGAPPAGWYADRRGATSCATGTTVGGRRRSATAASGRRSRAPVPTPTPAP